MPILMITIHNCWFNEINQGNHNLVVNCASIVLLWFLPAYLYHIGIQCITTMPDQRSIAIPSATPHKLHDIVYRFTCMLPYVVWPLNPVPGVIVRQYLVYNRSVVTPQCQPCVSTLVSKPLHSQTNHPLNPLLYFVFV